MGQAVSAIILAAGESSRMGQPKSLLPWAGGNVLQSVLGAVRAAGLVSSVVVTGAHHREITGETDLGDAQICHNPDWEQGMGSSIRRGVDFALGISQVRPSGLLVLLADQPMIGSDYLTRMLREFSGAAGGLVASAYPQGPGVPALFGQQFFDSLQALPFKSGAKNLIRQQAGTAILLDPGPAGQDMDTPEAYQALRKRAGLDK
ncbi:NTP transferase domain-containing protein [Robiginitalea sp. SC105]|uniref:nucleotidyltransferase family protein n=1 Tax=Robiginitalea sp. SC105 TaxID=2762332 RepID=UPI001639E7A5|nr:nucleotidyltransferase family protein [Robiginitalea sp. SC105]MBC2840558.1 nucleotidyltransferase family protein [Robiginitalea sp. SC105]